MEASTEIITGWVARDENGDLCVFKDKPVRGSGVWKLNGCGEYAYLDEAMFPEVTWEDSEPSEVEITIKRK